MLNSMWLGASGLTIVPQTKQSSAVSQTTYSFANTPLGTPSSDRLIVIAVFATDGLGTYSISSATINGVSATINAQEGDRVVACFVISAIVPTGTQGTVSITFSESISFCVDIYPFALYNTAGVTQHDFASNDNVSASSLNASLDVLAGGIIFGLYNNNEESGVYSWTNLNEYDESNNASNNARHGIAYKIFDTAQVNQSITATTTVAGICSLLLVSFSKG